MTYWHIEPLGCRALRITAPRLSRDRAAEALQALADALRGQAGVLWLDALAGPTSVTAHYDPLAVPEREALLPWLTRQIEALSVRRLAGAPRHHEIPICFGGEFGPDLGDVAQHARLSLDETIALLTRAPMRVASLGFLPGFGYLEGVPAALQMPRRATPRVAVPTGSLALAAGYAGIYPLTSPGGWNLVGRTPLSMLDFSLPDSPAILSPGDLVTLRAISEVEFSQLRLTRA